MVIKRCLGRIAAIAVMVVVSGCASLNPWGSSDSSVTPAGYTLSKNVCRELDFSVFGTSMPGEDFSTDGKAKSRRCNVWTRKPSRLVWVDMHTEDSPSAAKENFNHRLDLDAKALPAPQDCSFTARVAEAKCYKDSTSYRIFILDANLVLDMTFKDMVDMEPQEIQEAMVQTINRFVDHTLVKLRRG